MPNSPDSPLPQSPTIMSVIEQQRLLEADVTKLLRRFEETTGTQIDTLSLKVGLSTDPRKRGPIFAKIFVALPRN